MEVRTERLVIGADTPLPLEGIHFRNIAPVNGPDGGAVWNAYALPVGIALSAFTGTQSSWNSGLGGAVFNSGEMRVSGSTFGQLGPGGSIVATSVPTAWRGGGVFNSGTLHLESDVFYGASARDGGGSLWNEGTASVAGSRFQSGTAQRGGGIANSGTLGITDSRFSDLSASEGGAVWNSGTLRFHGVDIFQRNRAERGPDRRDRRRKDQRIRNP
jgi:hypothetical protein